MTDTRGPYDSVDTSDEVAIREVVRLANEAQFEPDRLLDLHTSDVVIVNIAGRRVVGRVDFEAAMRAALAGSLRNVETTVEVVDIRCPAPDVAIVSCMKSVRDGRSDAGAANLPASGAMTYAMVRTHEGWRIALAQTTPRVG